MAVDQSISSPDEGELVVCTVTEVKQNGAYVTLDEYDGINGFIFIGEVASGWIKNIRGYVRDGQRLICKVLRTRRDGDLFMPLGAPGRKKLSDWMIDRKWTNIQKLQTPVFLNSENEIIWIPGFAPAFSRKIKEADHRVIRLTYNVSSTLL